jgi:hypothetical protein
MLTVQQLARVTKGVRQTTAELGLVLTALWVNQEGKAREHLIKASAQLQKALGLMNLMEEGRKGK